MCFFNILLYFAYRYTRLPNNIVMDMAVCGRPECLVPVSACVRNVYSVWPVCVPYVPRVVIVSRHTPFNKHIFYKFHTAVYIYIFKKKYIYISCSMKF